MRHVADRPGLTAGRVPVPGSVELLVDLLLLHRLAQLPVLLDRHDHRYHLAAMTNHVVGVADGQFAHDGHGNGMDRQQDVTTRRCSAIKAEAKAQLPLSWEPVSGSEPMACRLQEARPRASCALAAQMTRVIAQTTLAALGLSDAPVHAETPPVPTSCYCA